MYHYFSAVDLKSGYWQKPVDPAAQPKTAFVTPTTLCEYLRVPLGLRNAPPYFMREINEMLERYSLNNSRAFVDDLLTGGVTWEDMLQHLKSLLLGLRDEHLLATTNKLRVGYKKIAALGHTISHGTIGVDPDKVGAI